MMQVMHINFASSKQKEATPTNNKILIIYYIINYIYYIMYFISTHLIKNLDTIYALK